MKHLLFASSIALFAVASCAQNGPGSTTASGGSSATGSGGSGNGSGGSTTGSGGSSNGSGGANAGSGGSSSGSGGTNSGSGGSGSGSGGSIGSGGSNSGSGGASSGSGGASNGTGGAVGNGGSGNGSGGSVGGGGTKGTGGSAAGGTSGALNIADIVPTGFDGYYWEATPSGNTKLDGTNYPFAPAAGGCQTGATWDTTGYTSTKMLTMKGTVGTPYTVRINVRGVVGTRCYTGGMPGPGATTDPNASGPNNTWYIGGKQFEDSIWNTYELHINNVPAGKPTVYFLNSFPNISKWCGKEATYEVKYDASFQALGGATISLTIHDSNCRTLANCGAVEGQATCDTSAARVIDMAGVSPAPMNFTQPRTGAVGGTTYTVQWLWIDVTSVTSP